MENLKGTPVLVTGASGFIGGRLAERLATEHGAKVTGSGRNFPEEASLRAAGVTIARAELTDAEAMAKLCEGQSIVFHVAAWLMRGKGGDSEAKTINVDAAVALTEAAARAKVKRLVLVSTIAVYGRPAGDEVDEDTPLDEQQTDIYGRTKAIGERSVRETAARLGLELAIVRPAMVYGPRSAGWTVAMLKLVKKGVPVLFGDAQGHAYPIYVDDLVDLLILAGTRPEAAGQAWNGADTPITRERFFEFYGKMTGRKPRRVPLWLARGIAGANQFLHLGIPLTIDRLETYVRRFHFVNGKAERLLGWRPRVSLDEGMHRSAEWLRQKGMLPFSG